MAENQNNSNKKNSEQEVASVLTQAGSIKIGGYCILKGIPCKVTEYTTNHNKAGSVKATIVGTDIFSNKKYEDTFPTSATVAVPNVYTKEYEVVDIDEDEFVSLLLPNGDLKSDIKLCKDDEQIYSTLKKLWK